MINDTIRKFGYPATLLREYDHWLVLLRPAQVTAGSLILAAKGDATAYGDLPHAAFAEQAAAIAEIEQFISRIGGHCRVKWRLKAKNRRLFGFVG